MRVLQQRTTNKHILQVNRLARHPKTTPKIEKAHPPIP